ncbi:Diacylglycerol O-acyltransferase 3 [Camellia lanceoleosa]|uniref:Diacylglycerol O-acyltransferase 3 n=1 Tax=Camellia lanceoleosa TaxID=1840588 RepID=A0ACC0GTG2_9ERIC|nr:Diacylglycerol O-acyltransferase 3 [Camellia lanceoleosa]
MGGKCKKSGAPALLEEFQRVLGAEGAVVGCKCMGKCRDGPNIRVLNYTGGVEAEGVDDSVRIPANPLCIGVGFEDVGLIVANFWRNPEGFGTGCCILIRIDC